jgi:hypothetical protein
VAADRGTDNRNHMVQSEYMYRVVMHLSAACFLAKCFHLYRIYAQTNNNIHNKQSAFPFGATVFPISVMATLSTTVHAICSSRCVWRRFCV